MENSLRIRTGPSLQRRQLKAVPDNLAVCMRMSNGQEKYTYYIQIYIARVRTYPAKLCIYLLARLYNYIVHGNSTASMVLYSYIVCTCVRQKVLITPMVK